MGVIEMTEATQYLIDMWCNLKGTGLQGLITLVVLAGVVIWRKAIWKIWRKPKKREDK